MSTEQMNDNSRHMQWKKSYSWLLSGVQVSFTIPQTSHSIRDQLKFCSWLTRLRLQVKCTPSSGRMQPQHERCATEQRRRGSCRPGLDDPLQGTGCQPEEAGINGS